MKIEWPVSHHSPLHRAGRIGLAFLVAQRNAEAADRLPQTQPRAGLDERVFGGGEQIG